MPLAANLAGARVLVTAASQGIGFAAAQAFLEEGARVVANSSNAARLAQATARLEPLGDVHGIVADLRLEADLDRLVDESVRTLGGLDTLVYVTGSPAPGLFQDQGYHEWEEAARLLVVSPAYLGRRCADAMIAHGTPGRMVFLTSIAIREPIATIATSSVCRIAVAGLVRTLAREVGPKGIRVNGIVPGYIGTGRTEEVLTDAARRKGTSLDVERSALEKEIPLRRIGSPEELARVIVFLGSEMSSYVSGAMLAVDGAYLRSVG